MKRYSQVRSIEHRVRASLQYTRWAERNRATYCVRCGLDNGLEVHHVVELYHVILGLWKFYGEWEAVFQHTIAMHEDDRCEAITLCDKCHGSLHPGRAVIVQEEDLHIDEWCAIPRKLDLRFVLGKKGLNRGEIGLLGFQTLLGLGWNIMNGTGGGRIIDFNWRHFAALMDKTPSISFSNGLDKALVSLTEAKIVDDWAKEKNIVEVHLSKEYAESLKANPWFMPITDAKTSRMTVLVLRWILGFQSSRGKFIIGREKLVGHMQLTTRTPTFVSRCVKEAVAEIPWASVKEDGDKFRFEFKKRGMTPIHSLRSRLSRNLSN